MSLLKLNLAPDQAGYSAADGLETLSVKLDGGASRFRQDILNAAAEVVVQWRVNPVEFHYLRSFYNLLTEKGTKAFLLDLYLDREVLQEHECHFMPGTFRLTGQQGRQFTVSAKLEVKPVKLTVEEDEAERVWVTLFGEFGSEYASLFPPLEATIDQIITFNLPWALYRFAGYAVEEPEDGWLRDFDPNNDSTAQRDAVLATIIYDLKNGLTNTYTIVEPEGGWLRTFDPYASEDLGGDLYDVIATLANEFQGTEETYTVSKPNYLDRALKNDSLVGDKVDILATLLLDLKKAGKIG